MSISLDERTFGMGDPKLSKGVSHCHMWDHTLFELYDDETLDKFYVTTCGICRRYLIIATKFPEQTVKAANYFESHLIHKILSKEPIEVSDYYIPFSVKRERKEEQFIAGLERLEEYLGKLSYDGNLGEICIITNPDGLFIGFEGKRFKVDVEKP